MAAPTIAKPGRIELELRVAAPPVRAPVGRPRGRGQGAIERVPQPEELARVVVEGGDALTESRVAEGAAVDQEQQERRLAPQDPHDGIVLSTPTRAALSPKVAERRFR